MKNKKDEKWLDERLSNAVDFGQVKFDSEKWKEKYILNESPKHTTIKLQKNIWRFIMKNKVTKYSVAAVVAFAFVLVLLNPFGSSKYGGVALAEVLEKVSQMKTIIIKEEYKFRDIDEDGIKTYLETHTTKLDMTEYISAEHGVVLYAFDGEELAGQAYFLKNTNQFIVILPLLKGYIKAPMIGDIFENIAKIITPSGLIEYFKSGNYKELGQSKFGDFDVEGFETTDPNVLSPIAEPLNLFLPINEIVGQIWIDLETSLPVGVEAEFKTDRGAFTGFKKEECEFKAYEFQWNAELPEGIFEPNIPENYRELKSDDFIPMQAYM